MSLDSIERAASDCVDAGPPRGGRAAGAQDEARDGAARGDSGPARGAAPSEGSDAAAAPKRSERSAVRASGRLRAFSVAAVVLVGLAGLFSMLPDRTSTATRPRTLPALPRAAEAWVDVGPPPPDAMAIASDLQDRLYRAYQRGPDTMWVSVDYYPAVGLGRHPEAQRLLLPAQGYAELTQQQIDIPLDRGPLTVNLVTMRSGNRHVATLYWYHVGGRTVASDHGYRAWLLYNRLWRQRSDVALVRVVSPVSGGRVDEAVAAQRDFMRAWYPALLRVLPE